MRVLHIVPSLDPASGGPARSVPALCAAEADAGAQVNLLCHSRDDLPEIEGITTRLVRPFPGTRQGPLPGYRRAVRTELADADLVHLHSLWNPPITMAASVARALEVPYVISPRGMLQTVSLDRKRRLKALVRTLWEHKTIERAAGFHFLSEQEQTDSLGFPRDAPAVVVPNGIEEDIADHIAPDGLGDLFPAARDRRIVLFLGRLHWSKNLELQLVAMQRVVRRHPNLLWVLVGPDEGEWVELRRMIADRELGTNVLWTGPLPRAQGLRALRDADVVLLTSRHEAHSMAMNEALALGAPLVMTASVGFPAAAVAGAAIEVPAQPDAVADAVESLLGDDQAAARLRAAGPEFARQNLMWPSIAARMLEFYARLTRAAT